MANLMEWINPCLLPLADNSCGNDLRFDDQFEAVKQEIEKISACDYDLIINTCHQMLCVETKDLRVAGYLLLALTQKYQRDGLLAGLYLYNGLIENFGTLLHPQSIRARAASINWLNTSRLKKLAASIVSETVNIHEIAVAVELMNDNIKRVFSDANCSFHALNEGIKKRQESVAQPANKTKPAHITQPTQAPKVDIEKQAPNVQKKLIEFWRKENKWLLSCQLARALRWNHSPPLSESGKTNLAPPRKEGLQILKRLQASHDAKALLEHCEAFFLEAGNAFYLDLQLYAYQAAINLTEYQLADFIKHHTNWYCQQNPRLLNASFADGLPFASQQTQQWLNKSDAKEKENPPENLQTTLEKIQQADNSLAAKLSHLQTLTPETPLEAFHLLKTKAQICARAKKEKLATIFYQDLLNLIENKCFLDWQPQETTLVWREAMMFFHQVSSNTLDKSQKKSLFDALQANIIRHNAEQACLWID